MSAMCYTFCAELGMKTTTASSFFHFTTYVYVNIHIYL